MVETVKTKKLLVAYNPDKPNEKSSDFVFPVCIEGKSKLFGLSSGKYFEYGMLVLVGRPVSVNDLFAKLVHSGKEIESVDEILESIDNYFELVKKIKIGNVIQAVQDTSSVLGVRLEKVSFKSPTKKRGLP